MARSNRSGRDIAGVAGPVGGRLVVMGHDETGAAAFVADGACEEVALAGRSVTARFLGGADVLLRLPVPANDPLALAAPPAGGWRCSVLTLQPGSDADYFEFIGRALGPLADAAAPGFHITPTLDLILVVEGELQLEAPTGQPRRLGAGDIVQLHGVAHRWRNVGDGQAVMFCVQIGAERAPAAT